jgi:hypothetical protein
VYIDPRLLPNSGYLWWSGAAEDDFMSKEERKEYRIDFRVFESEEPGVEKKGSDV